MSLSAVDLAVTEPLQIAETALHRHDLAAATHAYESLLDTLQPHHSGWFWYNLGTLYAQQKRYVAAAWALWHAQQLLPRSLDVRNNLRFAIQHVSDTQTSSWPPDCRQLLTTTSAVPWLSLPEKSNVWLLVWLCAWAAVSAGLLGYQPRWLLIGVGMTTAMGMMASKLPAHLKPSSCGLILAESTVYALSDVQSPVLGTLKQDRVVSVVEKGQSFWRIEQVGTTLLQGFVTKELLLPLPWPGLKAIF